MADKDEVKPVVDAFGVERAPDTGKPIDPPAPEAKPEVGADGKPVVKTEEKKPAADADLEKNPLVVELRTSIKTLTDDLGKEKGDKKSMGDNLSKLRQRLDKLEKGDKTDVKPVFEKSDIKRVKDYTKEEQDEMTPAEKALIESNADMKERINGMVATAAEEAAEKAAEQEGKTEEEQETERVNTHITEVVQPIALKLAQDDAGIANEIIANFNLFAGNDKADDKELAARMEKAALMTPKFVAQKEQKGTTGKAVESTGSKEDPHGVDAIVEAAGKGNSGKSFSL